MAETVPDVLYCPKCNKIVLEEEKELVVGDLIAAPVHYLCKTDLIKKDIGTSFYDCYD